MVKLHEQRRLAPYYDVTMTEQAWMLAGITRHDDSGELDRFTRQWWRVPISKPIEVVGDSLLYELAGPDKWRGGLKRIAIDDPDGILDQFLLLHEAGDDEIRRFAQRWGPLRREEAASLLDGTPATAIELKMLSVICREPMAAYREYSRAARAVLNVAAQLHAGKVGSSEDVSLIAAFCPIAPGLSPLEEAARQRLILSAVLGDWMRDTVHPELDWGDSSPTIDLRPNGSFGAIVTTLAFAVARTDGLALCASCGQAFVPPRRPAAGRRSYCGECGPRAARRDASRDYRRRKSQGKREGVEAKEEGGK